MFKVEWDKETGGVRLNSLHTKDSLGVSPRPVFFEELDLLQLDKLGWKYPHCKEPLMWCCNKSYYYYGELMFEAKGANVYDRATVVFQEGKEKVELKPMDMAKMLERCKNEMFLLETEAIEFIRDVYMQYTDASRKTDSIVANQIDFETLAARVSKERKQQMA
ncbi:MAG: phosphoadenosine phosphosulfate reductase, partial [Bacteroidales bacterium]|nr:phosphoadenosine phosphosulfate reductase [Bacteroidales bacterium]